MKKKIISILLVTLAISSALFFSGRPEALCETSKRPVELIEDQESGAGPKSRLRAVKDIRHRSYRNYTRVVVDLDGPAKYEHDLLKADPRHKRPCRLYVDLKNTRITSQIESSVAINDGLLQRARVGQYTRDTVRVVLDMEGMGEYKVFHLHDPFRIVVDVQRFGKEDVRDKAELAPERGPERKVVEEAKEPKEMVSLPSQPGLNSKKFGIHSLLPSSYELSGHVAAEGRLFFNEALSPEQERNNASFSLEPEFYCEWENGSSFTFTPFARLDSADSKRTHFDVRELNYLWLGDSWELRIGVGKVFWGVTEFTHLVDIINQTDAVESIDGEDKLGQPMAYLSIPRDWGIVDMFVLPYFRERTFPGPKGRLRYGLKVDTDKAKFESDAEEHHVDFAMRYSHTIGDWDIGVYHFKGTGREPTLLLGLDDNFKPILIPFYEQINQTGLDLQFIQGQWLFKLETIHRAGQRDSAGKEDDFFAGVGGFEYTFVRIAETYMDLGIIGEWAYDDRGDQATTSTENDIMFGLRLTVNDAASSEVLAGVSQDIDSSSRIASIEASRRFGDNWKATLEGMAFFNVPEDDLLYSVRDDDFVRLELAYYY